MRKKVRYAFILLLFVVAFTLLYLSIPQAKKNKKDRGIDIPRSTHWIADSVAHMKKYIENQQFIESFLLVDHGKKVLQYGATNQLINLHSLRKPIISLLIGIAKDKGMLSLSETLGELGITERNIELTHTEKSATIRDLLMSRSGIYIDADAQPDSDIQRPQRGDHKPGEYYYYNNFDFNVLATILKKKTGMSYEECLEQWLAIPLSMQDFNKSHVIYGSPFSRIKTNHPAYKTWMSARDLAKIGILIAQNGRWNGEQLISEDYLNESMSPWHEFDKQQKKWPIDSYGYLWGIDTEKDNIWGTGYGGQYLMIDRSNQLVLVQRHYTGNSILSQGLYLRKNTQGQMTSLMNVWYKALRTHHKMNQE